MRNYFIDGGPIVIQGAGMPFCFYTEVLYNCLRGDTPPAQTAILLFCVAGWVPPPCGTDYILVRSTPDNTCYLAPRSSSNSGSIRISFLRAAVSTVVSRTRLMGYSPVVRTGPDSPGYAPTRTHKQYGPRFWGVVHSPSQLSIPYIFIFNQQNSRCTSFELSGLADFMRKDKSSSTAPH